ncbi:hypothetical protein NX059_000676 [Plenodomus lindquistii]|nr:hypothetical protein NX059_000676 [Plenodomus lindquistii]
MNTSDTPSAMATVPSSSTNEPHTSHPAPPPSVLKASQTQLMKQILDLDGRMNELSQENQIVHDALIDYAEEDEGVIELATQLTQITSDLTHCDVEKGKLIQQLKREMSRLETLAGYAEEKGNLAERQMREIKEKLQNVTFVTMSWEREGSS